MDQGWAAVIAAALVAAVSASGLTVSGRGLNRIVRLTDVIEKMSPGSQRGKLIRLRGQLIDRYTRRRGPGTNWSNVWLVVDVFGVALYFAGALLAPVLGPEWQAAMLLVSLIGVLIALVGTAGILAGMVLDVRNYVRRRREANKRKLPPV